MNCENCKRTVKRHFISDDYRLCATCYSAHTHMQGAWNEYQTAIFGTPGFAAARLAYINAAGVYSDAERAYIGS